MPWLGLGLEIAAIYFAGQAGYDMTGWTKCYDCTTVPSNLYKVAYGNKCSDGVWCGLFGQVPTGPIGEEITANNGLLYFGYGSTRMTIQEKWARNVGVTTMPPWIESPPVWFEPPMVPWIGDPEIYLPLQPNPEPRDLPYRGLPNRRPHPQKEVGPKPASSPRPVGSVEFPTGDLKGRVRTKRSPTPRKRPPRGVKERKWGGLGKSGVAFARMLGMLSRSRGTLTEMVDFVAAIYAALPASVIASHPDNLPPGSVLPFMMDAIYQNFGQVDMTKAVKNIIANQIEDKLVGQIFRIQRKTAENLGYQSEYGAGLEGISELYKELHG